MPLKEDEKSGVEITMNIDHIYFKSHVTQRDLKTTIIELKDASAKLLKQVEDLVRE